MERSSKAARQRRIDFDDSRGELVGALEGGRPPRGQKLPRGRLGGGEGSGGGAESGEEGLGVAVGLLFGLGLRGSGSKGEDIGLRGIGVEAEPAAEKDERDALAVEG